jgi:hypothetical protein
MGNLKDSLKGEGEKSPPKDDSPFFILREETLEDIEERFYRFKEIAEKQHLCLRCLLNSDGEKRIEIGENFCFNCGLAQFKKKGDDEEGGH